MTVVDETLNEEKKNWKTMRNIARNLAGTFCVNVLVNFIQLQLVQQTYSSTTVTTY